MGSVSYYRPPGQSDLEHLRRVLFGDTGEFGQLLDGATVANVFYGAVRAPDGEIYALVVVQHRGWHGAWNYNRKEIPEHAGPVEARCPRRILKMLSPVPDCTHTETYCRLCTSELFFERGKWVSHRTPHQHKEVAGPRCFSGYPVGSREDGKPPLHQPGGTPPLCDHCNARAWREECEQNLERAAARPPLRTGDTFTCEEPIKFRDGVSETRFTVVDGRRNLYRRAGDGGRVTLRRSRWHWPAYTVTSRAS